MIQKVGKLKESKEEPRPMEELKTQGLAGFVDLEPESKKKVSHIGEIKKKNLKKEGSDEDFTKDLTTTRRRKKKPTLWANL